MEEDKRISEKKDLFNYYKLYLESVERISDRRSEANKFFITINTVLLSLGGIFLKIFEGNSSMLLSFLYILLLFGVMISIIFFFLINSYKQLNSGKFRIIHNLEKKLLLQLYTNEWKELDEGKNFRKYMPFSYIEIYIPIIFGFFYLIILILLLTFY